MFYKEICKPRPSDYNRNGKISYEAILQIEQNRCAMACQGCDAIFSTFSKKGSDRIVPR